MCGKDVRNGHFAAGASGVGSLNEYNYLAMLWLPRLLMENNLAILAALFTGEFPTASPRLTRFLKPRQRIEVTTQTVHVRECLFL
jgi:hypothetical protein